LFVFHVLIVPVIELQAVKREQSQFARNEIGAVPASTFYRGFYLVEIIELLVASVLSEPNFVEKVIKRLFIRAEGRLIMVHSVVVAKRRQNWHILEVLFEQIRYMLRRILKHLIRIFVLEVVTWQVHADVVSNVVTWHENEVEVRVLSTHLLECTLNHQRRHIAIKTSKVSHCVHNFHWVFLGSAKVRRIW